MKRYTITTTTLLLLVIFSLCVNGYCRGGHIGNNVRYYQRVRGLDTTLVAQLSTIFVFKKGKDGRALARRYSRMLNAIKLTYPMALQAKRELLSMERELLNLEGKAAKEYTKGVEERLKKQYTPILKRMSMYQGIILLKLIDRETGESSYQLVKELRGGFVAFFWQGVARLFGGNLKVEYDKENEDKIMEELLNLYKLGYI